MKAKKRIQILLAIAVVLAIWRIFDAFSGVTPDHQGTWVASPLKSGSSRHSVDRKMQILSDLPLLRFETEKAPVPDIDAQTRNPFTFGVNQKRQMERQQRMEELRQQALAEADLNPQPAQPEPPPRPEFDGTILGMFQDPILGRRIALRIEDELFIVEEGDMIKDTFRVKTITHESIVLLHVDRAVDLEIPLDRDPTTSSEPW